MMPFVWLATAPAARRYIVGWAVRTELHMLEPALLRQRASNVPGSAQMLEYGAACLYARRVIIASNKDLERVMPALRLRRELRWAWLLEGAARWFGGQTAHARPAIARRLREGGPPSFPPGPRDAALLGGTVIDLLAREQGAEAAARFACRTSDRRARLWRSAAGCWPAPRGRRSRQARLHGPSESPATAARRATHRSPAPPAVPAAAGRGPRAGSPVPRR